MSEENVFLFQDRSLYDSIEVLWYYCVFKVNKYSLTYTEPVFLCT